MLDVWAYGVTLWELFSEGSPPYIGMSNAEAVEKILGGYRLPKPDKCPTEIYSLMEKCWKENSMDRPTMRELYSDIDKICCSMNPRNTPEPKVTKSKIVSDEVLYNN